MVVGYVVADTSKKAEVLKIIATVLDFNEEERSKTGLGKGFASHGWLQSWFGGSSQAGSLGQTGVGHRRTTSGEVQAATGLDLGLAQAFVKFLETESKPKAPPLQVFRKIMLKKFLPLTKIECFKCKSKTTKARLFSV